MSQSSKMAEPPLKKYTPFLFLSLKMKRVSFSFISRTCAQMMKMYRIWRRTSGQHKNQAPGSRLREQLVAEARLAVWTERYSDLSSMTWLHGIHRWTWKSGISRTYLLERCEDVFGCWPTFRVYFSSRAFSTWSGVRAIRREKQILSARVGLHFPRVQDTWPQLWAAY